MKARCVRNRKLVLGRVIVQERIWAVSPAVAGSAHGYKYSLALIVDAECVLRYDNERGKGDHCHRGNQESAYVFVSLEKLLIISRSRCNG
jgi:hypothetical protein